MRISGTRYDCVIHRHGGRQRRGLLIFRDVAGNNFGNGLRVDDQITRGYYVSLSFYPLFKNLASLKISEADSVKSPIMIPQRRAME